MTRTLAIAATFVALSVTTVAADSEAACLMTRDIVTQAVALRLEGKGMKPAERQIKRELPAEKRALKPVVPALVQWVYDQPEEVLNADLVLEGC